MRPGDIVIHKKHGLLVVRSTETRDGMKLCKVTGRTMLTEGPAMGDHEHLIMEEFLTRMPEGERTSICSIASSRAFSSQMKQRGKDYFTDGRVGEINFEKAPRAISAVVHGNRAYRTTLLYDEQLGVLYDKCTCPVGSRCKHAVALTYALKEQIEELEESYNGVHTESETSRLAAMPIKEQFACMLEEPLTREKVVFGLKNLIYKTVSHSDSIARMLDHFIHGPAWVKEYRETICYAAALLPDGEFFRDYISAEARTFNNCSIQVPRRKSRPANINDKILYRYFKREFRAFRDNRHIYTRFILASPCGNKALTISREVTDEEGLSKIIYSTFPTSQCGNIAWVLMDDILRESGKEIEECIANLRAEIEAEAELERQRQLKRKLDRFCEDIAGRGVRLNAHSAAEMEFAFFHNQSDDGIVYADCSQVCVELRIGIARKYIVKHMLSFLDMFRRGAVFQYGKEFTFTHSIDNIVPRQQEAMRILLIAGTNMESYHLCNTYKAMPLDCITFSALIRSLEGTVIHFNDKPYLVTLDPVLCRIRMDKEYRLSVTAPAKNYGFISAGSELLLLNKDEQLLQRVSVSAAEKKLLLFAAENGDVSFAPLTQQFSTEVYSRFAGIIDLDSAVRGEIRTSDMEINAYFDFNNGEVSVREEYVKEGVPVTDLKTFGSYDRNSIENYENCLARLGFADKRLQGDADVLNFFAMDMTELKSFCNVYLSESIKNKSLQGLRAQTVRVQYENNIMQAFLESSEYSDDELKEILRAIRHKKKYVLLEGDRIVDLRGEEAEEFEATLDDLGIDEDAPLEPVQIPIARALRAFAHEKGCRIDDMLQNMIRDIRGFKGSTIPLPGVQATLRPYQTEGFRWMKILSDYQVGGILADDMGLGKTLQVITLLKSDQTAMPSLVVCPKSLVFNWINEFRRFDPEAEVTEVYGPAAQRHRIIREVAPDRKVCLVTSYDSLRSDVEHYDFPVNYMVLDEAQYIKNVNAQKSRSVKSVKAVHRLALTGTPIENNVIDLWSIFDFIMPGYLDDLTRFKQSYNANEAYTKQIARRIAPFLLRRTKKDVLSDLPDKYERILTSEMTQNQRKVYDAYRLEARQAIDSGSNAFDILPYLMRLREICDDPSLFVEGYTGGSGKMDALDQLLGEYLGGGHRILLFSQFVKAIEQIEVLLQKKGITYYKITGATPAEERIELMEKFNAGLSVSVFLISLKAGGTGLNLTGADTVIHFDPWWNVAAENQASDRAHRIGQTRNVEVIKLICEDSVEQKVIELQNMKKDLIDKLISDSDKSVTSVTLDDVRFILR